MHSFVPIEATLTLEDRMRAFSFWGFQSTAASPLHWKEPGDVVDKDASWAPSRWSILGMSCKEDADPGHIGEIISLTWLGWHQRRAGSGQGEGGLGMFAWTADLTTQTWLSSAKWMNGAYDNHCNWSVITASPNASYSAYYMNKLAALFRPW